MLLYRLLSKRIPAVSLLFVAMFLLYVSSYGQKKKKAVFIILDGIPADVIEKLPLGNLKSVKAAGGYTRSYVGGIRNSYNETPTISAVGYNSILTGVWANKHNVWDNDIAQPNYHYPTIFRLLKEQYPAKKIAIFSSWEDNRTKLVGNRLAATGNIGFDYSFDGLEKDTTRYPHDKRNDYMNNIDDAVAKKAAENIRGEAPDLSWVYLEYTDDMGHRYGDRPEFYKAVALADQRVGLIWKAIQYRQQQHNEDWMIIVTTDHGRDSVNGKGHGAQSARERSSWLFTNAKNLNEQFHAPLASATDMMPTIAKFMNIQIPKDNAYEIDGTPFIGKLSFIDPSFSYNNDSLQLRWTAVAKAGTLKIWMTTGNQYKTGGSDRYELLGTASIADGKASFSLQKRSSVLYKIVLETDQQTANYWIDKK